RLGHLVTPEIPVEEVVDAARVLQRSAENPGGDVPLDDRPRGVDRLRGVVGRFAGDAFAPGARPVTVAQLEEQDSAFVDRAARDTKWLTQGERNFVKRDLVN